MMSKDQDGRSGDPGAALYYHGRRGPAVFAEDAPAFFTTDRRGAAWYARERGDRGQEPRVYAARLDIRNPAGPDDLLEVIAGTGATAADVAAHTPYDGDNPLDFLYLPMVRQALEWLGFDGYRGWDALANGEIPVLVAFHPRQIAVLEGGDDGPV